jgi:hypothetical protein
MSVRGISFCGDMVVVASSTGGFSGHGMVMVEARVAPASCLLGQGRSVLTSPTAAMGNLST